jgi:Tfp pilus assembly protein PilF
MIGTPQPMPVPTVVGPPPAIAPPATAPPEPNPAVGAPPVSNLSPDARADIESKIQAKDYGDVTTELNKLGAPMSPDPFLCITHAQMMLQMENYRQARAEMTFFLQHTFDNPDAYITHAKAAAAMGDQRWADRDLQIAAQLRPVTADTDRAATAPFTALDPPGFPAAELPQRLDELVKMAGGAQPFPALVQQAMRIVKGECNIRRVESDEYRDRKRQLVAAVLAHPKDAQPLADLAFFLYEQSSAIHGDGREGVGIMAYRFIEPTKERQQAIACADAALRIDPISAEALSSKAGAMIALGDDDDARPFIDQALSAHPNDPELLRMFSQLMTRSAWTNSDAGDQLATPLMWEDDQYTYMQQRSPEDLAQARSFNAAAGDERDKAAAALQSSVDNTQRTAAGFYYQAVQFHRNREQDSSAETSAAAAMEQAIKLAPDDVGYRDFLAELYSHMGWRHETDFFTQWSIADNLGETSAAKMVRLAYKQLRRAEYEPARQSLTQAMQLDPADPRAAAYMGLLIAGENHDRARIDQSAAWLMAACALDEANLRLWGLRHQTPSITYTPDQVGLEAGLVMSAGTRLLKLNRPQDAAMLAQQALGDLDRVDKGLWWRNVPTAMLPVPTVQGTLAPHMDPVKAAPVYNTTTWAIFLHQLASNAFKSMGQNDQASQELAAAKELQQSMLNAQRNAPPAPMRR